MSDPFASALAAQFAAAGAEAAVFTPAATGTPKSLRVIREDAPAGDFNTPGNVKRSISFDIQKLDVPVKPVEGDTLATTDSLGNAELWYVNQILEDNVTAIWRVWVERGA